MTRILNAIWHGQAVDQEEMGEFIFIIIAKMVARKGGEAEDLNEAFIDYLKSFKVFPELLNLYLSIMEDIFKTKEGDREQEIARLQKNVDELEAKLFKIDEMYINQWKPGERFLSTIED